MMRSLGRPAVLVVAALGAIVCLGGRPTALAQETAEVAERVTAPKLFPEKTLAYIRVDDVTKLKADLAKSSLGKLGNDDKLKPILTEFYGSLVRNLEQMQEAIGLNLDEVLAIPSGELAIALLPSKRNSASYSREATENGGQSVSVSVEVPAVALILDAGEEISSVRVLLERMEQARGNQMVRTQKEVERLTLYRYQNPERQREQFAFFIDEGVLVGCSDADYLEVMAEGWLGIGGETATLSENRKFLSIMSRCVGTEGERPQVSFYADPWTMAREFTREVSGSTVALALLDSLGISDIEAVGGSWIVSPPDFDSISHMHLLLRSPPRGVMSLLRPKSGSTTPERWVPDSVASYSTINWDLGNTFQGVERLFDQFRGPDAMQTQIIDRVKERFDIDLRADVIDNLEGRITLITDFVRPVTINSGSSVYAIRLNNAEKFQSQLLPKLLELVEARTEVKTEAFGDIKAHVIDVRNQRNNSETLRMPEICIAVVDDYVLMADSRYMMRQIAGTLSGTNPPLSDALEYQLIADRISSQLQDKECSAISYARPEDSLQMFYELARDPKNKDRLKGMSENNPFFQALYNALDKHELPPFSVIAKYLAPGGGFMVEEETGLHYTSFSLRRD